MFLIFDHGLFILVFFHSNKGYDFSPGVDRFKNITKKKNGINNTVPFMSGKYTCT